MAAMCEGTTCEDEDEASEEGTSEEELDVIRICRTTNGNTLDLSRKKLTVIPDGVLKLSQVQYLYLQENLLEEIPFQLSENLLQLTWLDLRHNNIKVLPHNISLLRSLKNLLLQGNQIKKLPLELGLLTNLSGMNLKDNPLEFPPRNIIEQGSKTILKYLREQSLAVHLQMKKHNIQDSNDQERNNSSYVNKNKDNVWSGREVSPLRKVRLHSAPTYGKPGRLESNLSKISDRFTHRDSGYMRSEPIQTTYHRQVEEAERKKFNEKTDAILQKQRNKVALSEWRKESGRLQRSKYQSRSADKHEISMPYANDISPSITAEKKDAPLDKKLEERIKEHVHNIKEWTNKDKSSLTVEEQVEAAKDNLDKVMRLHKELGEQRTVLLHTSNLAENNKRTVNH